MLEIVKLIINFYKYDLLGKYPFRYGNKNSDCYRSKYLKIF